MTTPAAQPGFGIDVYCSNCGDEWSIEVPFKSAIIEVGGVFVHPGDCHGRTGLDCKGYRLSCVKCGLDKHVQRRYGKR